MMKMPSLGTTARFGLIVASLVIAAMVGPASAEPEAEDGKPVLLYATVFHADGATEYAADGPYAHVLEQLGDEYEVRISDAAIDRDLLAGVDVVLIANPNKTAVGGGPEPHHVSREDTMRLVNFVANGGGLIFLSNQSSAHNCEKEDANRLLSHFGVRATHYEVGVKRYVVPESDPDGKTEADRPAIGGLGWAFYYGCVFEVDRDHLAQPRILVNNQRDQPVERGQRGPDGPVLVSATVGEGRAVFAGDAGFVTDWAIRAEEEDRIKDHDNLTLFRRLVDWTAQR